MKTLAYLSRIFLIFFLPLPGIHSANAATWYVSTNGIDSAAGTNWATAKLTIQAAIDKTTNGDTVVVSNGIYSTGGRTVIAFTVTNRVAITNAIKLLSLNGPLVTTIQGRADPVSTNGNAAVRCVYAGTNSFISGFTLAGGHTKTNGTVNWEQSGGGIWCEVSAVVSNCILVTNGACQYGGGSYQGTLINCTLSNNSVSFYGGGSGYGTLKNCTLSGNSSASQGGGSYSATLNNCTLIGNSASAGGGSYAGTLTNCTITCNSASYGGGSYYGTLVDCAFIDNSSAISGGGSCNGTLNKCTLSGNSSANGGGSYFSTLSNCVLNGNSAASGGGSCYGTLNNCTLIANAAFQSGGGSYTGTLNNCIVFHNTAPSGPNHAGSTFNHSCTDPSPGGTGNITNEPRLASISHLSVGSPCIGAGSIAYASGTDVDGEPWLNPPSMGCDEVNVGSITGTLSVSAWTAYTNTVAGLSVQFRADIAGRTTASSWQWGDGAISSNLPYASHVFSSNGVYAVVLTAYNESYPLGVAATVTVQAAAQMVHYVRSNNPAASAPYTSWAEAATNIQDAIDAVSQAGALVLVSNGVYATGGRVVRGSLTNRVAITNVITLLSVNGPEVTTIQGRADPLTTNGNAAVRCAYAGPNSFISGFALAGGHTKTNGDWYTDECGGGVWCEVSAVLSNCTVSTSSAYGYGGGAFQGTLNNCALTGNWVQASGGGSYNGTLNNCILAGNSAAYGGGSCLSTLNNCTLASNSASTYGGGSYTGKLNNCTLTGNSAPAGGASYGDTLNNCILTGNSASDGGGSYRSKLNNCTLTGNSAIRDGGGAYAGTLNNCITYHNTAFSLGPNYASGATFNYSCTVPSPGGTGNITNDPQLASLTHLAFRSPCIGAGSSAYASVTDIDGESWLNPPSMGCDEVVAGSITGALSVSAWAAYTSAVVGLSIPFRADISGRTTASAWQWGDGSISSNQPYVAHTFSTGGVFAVVLRAYNESYPLGLAATVTVQVATQMIHYVRTNNPSAASPYTSWATAATNIQMAIDAVSQAGALVLVSNGMYSSGGRAFGGALTNRVAITNVITLRSVNGPTVTAIIGRADPVSTNGDAAVRCVYAGTNSFITGFTLAGGHTRANGALDQVGGGVLCAASAVVSNCMISSNSAFSGGGGAYQGALNNCTVTSNSAPVGGGVYYATLNNCALMGNTAGNGGGSFSCSLSNCTLTGNSALWGGGGSYADTLTGCTISNNSTPQYGGGAMSATMVNCLLVGNTAGQFGGAAGTCRMTNCIVVGNSASCGGGSWGGTSFNCIFSGNAAITNGGGSYFDTMYNCVLCSNAAYAGGGSANGTLYNCTLSGNSAQFGGGSYTDKLYNCIVYFNQASIGANSDGGSVFNSCCTMPLPVSGMGNFTNQPALAGLSNPHLTQQSPCIDAGSNQYVVTTTDLDGNPRTNGPAVDIGSIEFASAAWTGALTSAISVVPTTNVVVGVPLNFLSGIVGRPHHFAWSFGDGSMATDVTMIAHAFAATGDYPVVLRATNLSMTASATVNVHVVTLGAATRYVATSGNDASAGTNWTTAKATIRAAITNMPVTGGLVLVSNGVYSTGGTFWKGLTNRIVLTNYVTVQSVNGPTSTCIRGAADPATANNGNAAVRCSYLGAGCTLSGFTLSNGYTTARNDLSGCGGGVFCETPQAIVTNCLFVTNGAYWYGGGSYGGTLNNCTLSGNRVDLGSGGGAAYAALQGSTLSNNYAGSYGGGAYAAVLTNCLICTNRAGSGGGGSSQGVMNNCTISNNTGGSSGGGSYKETLNNCVLVGNRANFGGGAYQSSFSNSSIAGNSASFDGGGSAMGSLVNCTLSNNAAARYGGGSYVDALAGCAVCCNTGTSAGGGAYGSALIDCTVSGNLSKADGGGTYCSTQSNCSIVFNVASNNGGGTYQGTLDKCTLAGNVAMLYGGGAYSGTLTNCTLSGNLAKRNGDNGGGAYGSILDACVLSGNVGTNGGGVCNGTLNNCLLSGNSAYDGGGAYNSTLINCTLATNVATYRAGGADAGRMVNCIVYFNSAPFYSNTVNVVMTNCCTTPMPASGSGNITNDPRFVNITASNFHLLAASLCIDTGRNESVQGMTDLDGNLRIVNGKVDMGAYEFRAAGIQSLVWYVDPGGNDSAAGTNWATAKQTIQAATEHTLDGDLVLVSNGVYETGGRAVAGSLVTNRVAISNAIVVQSVNGPSVTTIRGAQDPVGTTGVAGVRCVYLASNAVLDGFTLIHGATRSSGDAGRDCAGGGAWCESGAQITNCAILDNAAGFFAGGVYRGTLNNCSLTRNSALNGGGAWQGTLHHCVLSSNSATYGGGSYMGTLVDCTFSGNMAQWGGGSYMDALTNCVLVRNRASLYGGGACNSMVNNCSLVENNSGSYGGGSYQGVLNNCLVAGNISAAYGGGVYNATLYNCTVAGNSATNFYSGGGICQGSACNCIIVSNSATGGDNYYIPTLITYSCTTPMPGGGSGNTTNDPQFVNAASSNYHLRASSPCIDAGSNADATNGISDLDGNLRIGHGKVDMGAYEFQPYWWWASDITNSQTNLADCATDDGYPNLLKFASGSSATQSDALARMNCAWTNGLFTLRFNRNTNAFDVTLFVEGSYAATNDAPWTGIATNINGSWGGATNVVESGTGTPAVVTIQDTAPPSPNRFLRLRVTRP